MHKNFALYALAAVAALSLQATLARVNVDIGVDIPVAPIYVEPTPVYAPPPPPAYYAPAPVYIAPQPVIIASGYYDDGRGHERQECRWCEQRWHGHEWRRHHHHGDDD